jgi:2-phospho-L-lactate transferase/gluconeogenesis factor (CofD/UPF0052 family)
MKVLIFSGGTGSIALQTGLYAQYNNLLDVQILTNLYDNGKSTGAVRQVYNGKILGPSDLRKNQTTQFKLRSFGSKFQNSMLKFLEHRFNCQANKAHQYCLDQINKIEFEYPFHINVFTNAVNDYFNQPLSTKILYNDFSISNIVYAGLAGMNNNSMSHAGEIMEDILQLPKNCVIINDDTSLFLRAITTSGHHILDEGEIVDWNNGSDEIIGIYFKDVNDRTCIPTLSAQAEQAINDADIIIFSSGTQWSSLIPTYASISLASKSVKDILNNAPAEKFFVVNNQQDKDMIGMSFNDVYDILDRYLPMKKISFVFNVNADKEMLASSCSYEINSHSFILSKPNQKTHTPAIARRIMMLYYKKYLKNNVMIFDYDDTLVGRNNEYAKESIFNLAAITRMSEKHPTAIITGNYIKSIVDTKLDKFYDVFCELGAFISTLTNDNEVFTIKVYADGGINGYDLKIDLNPRNPLMSAHYQRCISMGGLFSEKEMNSIVSKIAEIGISSAKIQNRSNATISIKPIEDEYRKPLAKLLSLVLADDLNIRPTGRTTIDISKSVNSKLTAFNDIENTFKNKNYTFTYVGDEPHDGGNDQALRNHDSVDFLHVKNPRDTAVFLTTYICYAGEPHE